MQPFQDEPVVVGQDVAINMLLDDSRFQMDMD